MDTEYSKQGIVAFAIHPGGVVTELGLGKPDVMHGLLQDTPAFPADTVSWLTQERRPWLGGGGGAVHQHHLGHAGGESPKG